MMSETGKLYRTEVRKKGKKNREKGLFFATILQIVVRIILEDSKHSTRFTLYTLFDMHEF